MCENLNREKPLLNKELVRKHFNRHAYEYDEYAMVQLDMGRQLLNKLRGYHQSRGQKELTNILEIGCGTGNLTMQLINEYPHAQYTAIDISASMIERTKDKLGSQSERVDFIAGDAEELDFSIPLDEEYSASNPIQEEFDLIISNATFQWFNRPTQTVHRYIKQLQPQGLLAFSTFAPRTFYELHDSFSEAHTRLGVQQVQHGQSFLSGEQWQSIFAEAVYGTFQWQEESRIEKHQSVRDFMHSIKRIGASNAVENISKGRELTNRKLLTEMERFYAEKYSLTDGISATYQIGYGTYYRD